MDKILWFFVATDDGDDIQEMRKRMSIGNVPMRSFVLIPNLVDVVDNAVTPCGKIYACSKVDTSSSLSENADSSELENKRT